MERHAMTLAFDIDGVLARWDGRFADQLNDAGAQVVLEDEPQRWGWPLEVATPEQNEAAWQAIGTNPQWWGTLPVHPDVDDDVKARLRVLHERHHVYFVTSRNKNARRVTETWLERHLGIHAPSVVVVPKSERKAEVLSAMRMDVILEDRPETLHETLRLAKLHRQPKPLAILVARPYNERKRRGLMVVPSTKAGVEYLYGYCL